MASMPFDISPIIARLQTEIDRQLLDSVGSAAQYSKISDISDFRPRTAFVLLAREKWDKKINPGGKQCMQVSFGIVTAVQNYRDARKGAETADELDPLVGIVRDAIIGWVPPHQGARQCKLIDGGVLDYDANTLLWIDVYETQHFIGGA